MRIKVTRDRKCKKCNGTGGSQGEFHKCHLCSGSGYNILSEMREPGIVKEIKVICDDCNWSREYVSK